MGCSKASTALDERERDELTRQWRKFLGSRTMNHKPAANRTRLASEWDHHDRPPWQCSVLDSKRAGGFAGGTWRFGFIIALINNAGEGMILAPILVTLAVPVWLVGRAFLYVLAGR